MYKTPNKWFLLTVLFFCTSVCKAQDNRLWATYYGGSSNNGGSGEDYGTDVAIDLAGNVYMCGETATWTGLSTLNAYQTFSAGGWDAYLVKFDSTGKRIWATYYGGPGDESSSGIPSRVHIALDPLGNVYLSGSTTSPAGIAYNGFQNVKGNGRDAFLVKFDSTGKRLWGTYYGEGGDEFAYNIAADTKGNVYLLGTTNSSTGIASGGFQNSHGGGSNDAFLVKFNSTGGRVWATYFGGSGNDEGSGGISIDPRGNIYFSGRTDSNTGLISGGFQTGFAGGTEAFLVKIDSSCNVLWSTYYGGTAFEDGQANITDASGNVYLLGSTNSNSGIAFNGFQNTRAGDYDAYLVKFDSSGSRLWATYYGGADWEMGFDVGTNSSKEVFITGRTRTTSGIAWSGFMNSAPSFLPSTFLVKFDSTGVRYCATYYGGPVSCNVVSLGAENGGNVYLAGITDSQSMIASGGYQNTFGGGSFDGFLAKFSSCGILSSLSEPAKKAVFTVLPNPTNGVFIVEGANEGELTVTDALGRGIYFKDRYLPQTSIDITTHPPGVYFVFLKTELGTTTRKVVLTP